MSRPQLRASGLLLALVLLTLGAPSIALAQQGVSGSGDRSRPPVLSEGTYTDLLGQPSALWYAIAAVPGQQITVEIGLAGQQGGPEATSAALEVEVEDEARQSRGIVSEAFTGRQDVTVRIEDIDVTTDVTLLRVGLRALGEEVELAELGYPLTLEVMISGEPAVASEPPDEPTPIPGSEVEAPTASVLEDDGDSGGGVDGARLGAGLFAFAAGCAVGYEMTRRR